MNSSKTNTLDELKLIPILEVARCLGIQTNQRRNIRCPFPDHPDKNPSFSFILTSNRCWCFGCGRGGSVIDLVALVLGISARDAISWLRKNNGSDVLRRKQPDPIKTTKPSFEIKEVDDFIPNPEIYEYLLSICPLQHQTENYLNSRGFSATTLSHFRVGALVDARNTRVKLVDRFSEISIQKAGLCGKYPQSLVFPAQSVLFPYIQNGEIVYIQSRILPDAIGPRWMGLQGIKKPVYNIDVIARHKNIYICEGVTDVLSAYELKIPAIGLQGASSQLPKVVLNGLKEKIVNIISDKDDAGKRMASRLTVALRNAGIQSITKTLPIGNDLNEYLLMSRREA